MAFIQNDGDIILDAVLTDLGRQRMSRGDGSFKITKFSLSDDEINYANYDENTGIGNTPILEAMTNNSSTLKSFLVTYYSNNLLYLPLDKILESKKKDDDVIDATSDNTNQNSLIEKIRRNRDSFSNRKRDLYNE